MGPLCVSFHPSETESQAELDAPHRAGDFVFQKVRICLNGDAGRIDVEVGGLINAGELRMFENIIRLSFEDQSERLAQGNLLGKSHIPVVDSRSREHILRSVAQSALSW